MGVRRYGHAIHDEHYFYKQMREETQSSVHPHNRKVAAEDNHLTDDDAVEGDDEFQDAQEQLDEDYVNDDECIQEEGSRESRSLSAEEDLRVASHLLLLLPLCEHMYHGLIVFGVTEMRS